MSDIPITCHDCGHQAAVPLAFAGKRVRCLRCQTKLRVPEPKRRAGSGRGGSSRSSGGRGQQRSRQGSASQRRGVSESDRRRALKAMTDILEEYEHAIEAVDYGFLIDIRGSISIRSAQQLRQDILNEARGVQEIFIAGGGGEVRLTAVLAGAKSRNVKEFATEDEDTAVFSRDAVNGDDDSLDVEAIVAKATGGQVGQDAVQRLIDDAAPYDMSESLVPVVPDGSISGGSMTPDSVESLIAKGLQLADQGKFPEAIRLLERAVRIDKNNSEAVSNLGRIYAQTGEYDRARRAFRLMAKLAPKDPEGHIMHAAAAIKCERLEDARNSLVIAIRLDGNNPMAFRYAAKLYQKLGDPVKARQFEMRYRQLKAV